MADPAIAAVMAALVARLESITPIVHPEIPFSAETGFVDPAESPETVVERRFRLRFMGLTDLSNEGQDGVVNVGLADRRARFEIRVQYPITAEDVDLALATDSELVQRAFARTGWTGSPIRRAVVATAREGAASERLAALRHVLEVQYRDVQ